MDNPGQPTCTAFAGNRRVAAGPVAAVARAVKAALDAGEPAAVLIFDDATSRPVEIDFRGNADEVLARLDSPPARGPGRPRLGVVPREVTLLPRQWEWLNAQPGGASVALRKLVDEARRGNEDKERARLAQEAAYRFVTALAGNEMGYEEAVRELFAGNRSGFEARTQGWPPDVRDHARKLASPAFAPADA
jgi:hypothetical protein